MTCRINHANETLLEGVNETRGAQAPSVAPAVCTIVPILAVRLVALGTRSTIIAFPIALQGVP